MTGDGFNFVLLAGSFILAALSTILATSRVLAFLEKRQILDVPNTRSSHARPTPRGGGLATTPVMAAALLVLAGLGQGSGTYGWENVGLGAGALALLMVSWWDDRHGLPALPRFASHAFVVALFLFTLGPEQLVFQGALPLWLDRALTGIAWLWFVNLYNFMDGIDGITGVETVCLGVGIALVAALSHSTAVKDLVAPALATAAIGAGFLVFNWHPAKLFLGDSGSIPFGFVLGGLLVLLAVEGHLLAALILPAYYLTDATITLVRRMLNGERIWEAHRTHFYQKAVLGGRSHRCVALAVLGANLLLIGCAGLAAVGRAWPAALAGFVVTSGLIGLFVRWSASHSAADAP